MKYLNHALWSIRLTTLVSVACLSLVAGVAPAQEKNSAEDEIKHLIVMISGKLAGDDTSGAGIIFGQGYNRLYIATANHVVRRGEDEAQDLRVEFKSLIGERIEAKLLRHKDLDLDLAVLSVVGLEEHKIPVNKLPFDRLGNPSALIRRDGIYHVGYANGNPWAVNVQPDLIAGGVGNRIQFQSTSINPGDSGGGLFNDRWELVGMIRSDQPPDSMAVNIASILETLAQWGYPVNLVHRIPTTQRVQSIATSLVIPGLGQHLQGRHRRGLFYEGAIIGAGVAVLWATKRSQQRLDDYNDVQARLQEIAPQRTELTSGFSDLFADQETTYNRAKSARRLAIATQIALGVVWGINALDAGVAKPAKQRSRITLGAHPTADGGRFLVRMQF